MVFLKPVMGGSAPPRKVRSAGGLWDGSGQSLEPKIRRQTMEQGSWKSQRAAKVPSLVSKTPVCLKRNKRLSFTELLRSTRCHLGIV
jgi:hypothetical protein